VQRLSFSRERQSKQEIAEMLSLLTNVFAVLLAGLTASAQQNTPSSNQGIGASQGVGAAAAAFSFLSGTQFTTQSAGTTFRAGPSFSAPRINIDATLRGQVCDPLADSEPSLSLDPRC